MSSTTKTIGILAGSFRKGGNSSGIAAWLASRFEHVQHHASPISISTIDTSSHPFPIGPVQDPVIPMTIKQSSEYPSPHIREWSNLITSLSGLIIVTPQYNWGYPGELKNALDNLYHEWKDLPVVVVTFGGHGGGKAGAQLRQVLEGALHVKLVTTGGPSEGNLEITLPREYIAGGARVGKEEWSEKNDFLTKYEETADQVLKKLVKEVLESDT